MFPAFGAVGAMALGLWLLAGARALPQSQPGAPVPLADGRPHVVEVAPGEFAITALPASLTQPGIYRLAASLWALELPSPTTGEEAFGIVVRCDHVTIDLGGHELVGARNTLSGIVAVQPRNAQPLVDLCVRNGTLRQWGAWGLDAAAVSGVRVADVCAIRNGGAGKQGGGLLLGPLALATGCQADWNSTWGLSAAEGALVRDCSACGNAGTGLALGQGARADACSASRNAGVGFEAGSGCTLQGCSASANGSWGISTGSSATVRACDAWGNTVGIGVAAGALVSDSHASENERSGLQVRGEGSRIDGNHLSGNGIGLEVLGRGNLLVRNSSSGNSEDLRVPPFNTSGGFYEAPSPYAPHPPVPSAQAAAEGAVPAAGPKDPLDDLRPWANIVH